MVSPKEDVRYSSERQVDRYYDERGGHYYRDIREDRDGGLGGNGNLGRHSQEPEPDRGKATIFLNNCKKENLIFLVLKL